MKNFSTWVIVGMALIIVVLAIILVYKPEPKVDHEKIRLREKITSLQSKFDSVTNYVVPAITKKSIQDSIRFTRRDSIHRIEKARLRKEIKSVNFSASTDKQLDSLIKILYP